MAASKIMVIRHGEKPDGKASGVDIDGKKDDSSLIPRGWQRAGALATLFDPSDEKFIAGLAKPQYLYASDKSEETEGDRPRETITPLSEKLDIGIDTSFKKDEGKEMAAKAMKKEGIVLICWEHENIHHVANAIMGNDTSVPQKWPGDRFD